MVLRGETRGSVGAPRLASPRLARDFDGGSGAKSGAIAPRRTVRRSNERGRERTIERAE